MRKQRPPNTKPLLCSVAALIDGSKAMCYGFNLKCGLEDSVLSAQSLPLGTIILVIFLMLPLRILEIYF